MTAATGDVSRPRFVVTVLFPGFELLDVFGPLEVFGMLPDRFSLTVVGPEAGPVASAQGPEAVAAFAYASAPAPDVVLVPGGRGTRALVGDSDFLGWLAAWSARAEVVASVCTGSGLLAAAGLLDGYRATSNRRAFAWAREQGPNTGWEPGVRWVHDRDRWSSAGVSAGIDMALALVAHFEGADAALEAADRIELEWRRDPSWQLKPTPDSCR